MKTSHAIAAALVAFAASANPMGAATAAAQTLNLAVGAPVTSLDPHYHALSPNYAVADMLFDSLTTFVSTCHPSRPDHRRCTLSAASRPFSPSRLYATLRYQQVVT